MADGVMLPVTGMRYHRNYLAWSFLGCAPVGFTPATYPPLLTQLTAEGTGSGGGSGSGGSGGGGDNPVYRPPLWQGAKR